MFRETKEPPPIVCLTFDFDTQSGFIARGMTTRRPLAREFGLVAPDSRLLHPRLGDLVHSGFTIGVPHACEAVVRAEVAHHSWVHVRRRPKAAKKRKRTSYARTKQSRV
jgi:hypothetical protein